MSPGAVIDIGACVCMQDTPCASGRRVYLYANQRADDELAVRDANFARAVIAKLTGDSIIEGYPSEEDGYRHLWRITLRFNVRKGGKVRVQTDYQAFFGCPVELRQEMMDLYYHINRNMKRNMKT